jgi:hypothetical protein
MILLCACGNEVGSNSESVSYPDDSLFIANEINCWIDNSEHLWFEKSRFHRDLLDTLSYAIYVDTILYNPEETKLYSVVIIEYDESVLSEYDQNNFYASTETDKLYDVRGLIGFKDSNTVDWSIYHYSPLIPVGFSSYSESKRVAANFFYNEFKNRSGISGLKNGEIYYEAYAFNINDDEFWEGCFIWERGKILPGYYNFQLENINQHKTPKVIERLHCK